MDRTGDIVPEYRIYHLDRAGRVSSADWLDADGDQAAIGAARDCNTLQCELWQGRRLVTKLAAGAEQSTPVAARRGLSSPRVASRA